jgi:hypothetical protein
MCSPNFSFMGGVGQQEKEKLNLDVRNIFAVLVFF